MKAIIKYNTDQTRWEGYVNNVLKAHTVEGTREDCAALIEMFEQKGYEIHIEGKRQ
ncbi:hypothetical protein SAMN05192534_12345 [Alteribacillus persepolensis]|uniref:Uncharacterized protein n=1 Tax=Alteribacillus persepolensis TaxID=568899 RepID=A0A1G8I9A7_9BACI|nr:hypothetical protein [Alteribacillus persepolensis]SDI15341.1 hypothetical protein SAMN05192534_12345 [Alteribacillus persepolensis]